MTRARKPPSSRTLDWHSAGWKAEKSQRLLKKKTSNVSVKSSSQLLFRTLSNASRKRRTPNCSRQVKKKNLENKFAAEDATLAICVQQLCSKL